MVALAFDENFNNDIIRGLVRREPDLDAIRIQDSGLSGADDEAVLEWAAENGRVLITHDVNTLPKYAYDRIASGKRMPGVFALPRSISITTAIEDLILIAQASHAGEWEGQVRYLPLREA